MLKKIIKRDGREEDVIPSKVNGWGEWASQNLEGRVDWGSIVLYATSTLPEIATSEQLQNRLIDVSREQGNWAANKMAGKLYSAQINKKIHPEGHPSIQALHRQLADIGMMRPLAYTDEEYAIAESLIDHRLDQNATYFELHQVREKYSIKNRVTGQEYETQQFVYMRMAMALAEDQPAERRMHDLERWYTFFSRKKLNAPTPNYLNLGTHLRGYASCCLYATNDSAPSLAIGDHIAYTMTYMSAGIGGNVDTRSMGDPIRGGAIRHQGKLPYFRSLSGAIKANLQNGRGGACTTYFGAFDPEAHFINMMKNPRTPADKQIRDIDFAILTNKFFARKVARNEQVFVFNSFTAPELHAAFYSGDAGRFEKLYAKFEADESFKKKYISAREMILQAWNQAFETGRHYAGWIDEMNRHTPFKDVIRSSNLCTEVMLPTEAYDNMMDLYSTEDHGRGEVGLCSLAGAIVSNIESDEEYAEVCYYGLLMIDKCIHQAEYALPHIGFTAKQRLSAGVGITGLAHHMAKKGLKYDTQEGKNEFHRLAETHAYHLINASLKLGQELGNAPWMHKTKWPEGWLPIDTYAKQVDGVVKPVYERDWEALRAAIIANGGIRNSVTTAHMPTESSSKASGAPNSLYPVRELAMLKTDENVIIDWAAPDGDILGDKYQLAWDIATEDMVDMYAIFQKFTDQGISADFYRRIIDDDVVTSDEMLSNYIYMTKMGLKTRYYQNSQTSKGSDLQTVNVGNDGITGGCASGACSL